MSIDAAVVAIVSDSHANSYDGLSPPYFEHEGGTHKANEDQRVLWHQWIRYREQVQERKRETGAPLITLLNGDLCDRHIKTTSLIVHNEVEMMRLSFKAHEPLIDLSDSLFVIDGTRTHTFGFEEKLAEDWGTVKRKNRYARPRVHLKIADKQLWAAHHGKMGRKGWTKRNAGNNLAADTLFLCAEHGIKPPDLIVRSHQHRWSDSYDNFERTRGLFTAGWQFSTEYIYTLEPDAIPEVGGLILFIEHGKEPIVEKFRADLRPERPEVVEL